MSPLHQDLYIGLSPDFCIKCTEVQGREGKSIKKKKTAVCVSTSICHHESLGKEQSPCSTGSDAGPSTARATRIILKDVLELPRHGGGIAFIFATQAGWPGCGRLTTACQQEGRSGDSLQTVPARSLPQDLPPPHGLLGFNPDVYVGLRAPQ